jgi:hypothetical protein
LELKPEPGITVTIQQPNIKSDWPTDVADPDHDMQMAISTLAEVLQRPGFESSLPTSLILTMPTENANPEPDRKMDFFALPLELRQMVHSNVLSEDGRHVNFGLDDDGKLRGPAVLSLLLTNSQINQEVLGYLCGLLHVCIKDQGAPARSLLRKIPSTLRNDIRTLHLKQFTMLGLIEHGMNSNNWFEPCKPRGHYSTYIVDLIPLAHQKSLGLLRRVATDTMCTINLLRSFPKLRHVYFGMDVLECFTKNCVMKSEVQMPFKNSGVCDDFDQKAVVVDALLQLASFNAILELRITIVWHTFFEEDWLECGNREAKAEGFTALVRDELRMEFIEFLRERIPAQSIDGCCVEEMG